MSTIARGRIAQDTPRPATLAALLSMLIVGGFIERRSVAELGFPARNALRELGLGLVLAAGLFTAIIAGMALCGW